MSSVHSLSCQGECSSPLPPPPPPLARSTHEQEGDALSSGMTRQQHLCGSCQDPQWFFLGAPRRCRVTSEVFTCEFAHPWRSLKALLLLIYLCPGCGCGTLKLIAILLLVALGAVAYPPVLQCLLLQHQPPLSFLLSPPNMGNWVLRLNASMQPSHHPLPNTHLCSGG